MRLEKYKAIFTRGKLSVEVTAICFEQRPDNEWYEYRLQHVGKEVMIWGATVLVGGASFDSAVARAKEHLDKVYNELREIVEVT